MKKRTISILAAVMAAALLWGCAPQQDTVETTVSIIHRETTAPTVPPETTLPTTQPEETSEAFRTALKTIHDDLVWPGLPGEQTIEIFEPSTIEDEQFAILDVDGDGEEELIVSVSDTYMAGMCEVVYGYDAASDSVRVETQAFPGATYYPGMMKVPSSHNQGHAGDVLWPYGIMTYNEASDTYEFTCFVDAWDRNLSETDFDGNPYPEDIDTDRDGYVYLITENDQQRILNRADFEAWEAELFAGKEPLNIPWQKLTAENIG